jgi:hypothetical protein
VVGEQQHVGRHVAARDQGSLRRAGNVAEQQEPAAADLDAHAERARVAPRAAGAGRRPERRHAQVAPGEGRVAGAALLHERPHTPGRLDDTREPRVGGRAPRQPHAVHRHVREHPGEAAPVVEVAMRRDDQVEPPDTEDGQRRPHAGATVVEALREREAPVDEQ